MKKGGEQCIQDVVCVNKQESGEGSEQTRKIILEGHRVIRCHGCPQGGLWGSEEERRLLTPCPLDAELQELTHAQDTQGPVGEDRGAGMSTPGGEQGLAGCAALRGRVRGPLAGCARGAACGLTPSKKQDESMGPLRACFGQCLLAHFPSGRITLAFWGVGHIGTLKTK